jgi:hypothetical protein
VVPHKVFLPVAGSLATLALSLTLLVTRISTPLAIMIIVIVGGLVILLGERLVHVADSLVHLTLDAKSLAFRLVAAAVVGNGTVAVILELEGLSALPRALLWQLGLAAVQVLVAVIADAYLSRVRPRLRQVTLERRRTRERSQVAVQRAAELEVGAGEALVKRESTTPDVAESHDIQVMRFALKKVKLGWVVILDRRHLSDARGLFGIQFDVQITAEAMSHKGRRTLPTEAAEPIAVALSELLNQVIETRWVGIQRLPRAGGYTITVTTQDVMARVYPFEDELEWASVRDPALIGYGLDAQPVHLLLRQHGQFLGKSRSGKSSLINCALAYLTRCRDAVVWICGTEKLYDMLAGWLEVYLDQDEEMPFDWVMAGPQDTAECLAALMRVARYRQSLRLSQRMNLPDIVCVLDEASFALRNTTITAEFDGRDLPMSSLCGMITQGAGSAGGWLAYATQRDTNDQLGPAGGDIQAQTGYTAAFGSQDNLSIGRQLGDFKLPPPAHKGEFYLKNDAAEQPYPILTKGRYLQEDDPSKPRLHDGLTVSSVSWSRRAFKIHLDEGSQRAAGELYLARPTRVTERFLDYLASPTTVTAPLDIVGARRAAAPTPKLDAVDADAADLARRMGFDFAALPGAQREAYREVVRELREADESLPALTPAPPRSTPGTSRKEQVEWVLREVGTPLTSREILDELRSAGVEVRSEGSVHNLLGKLVSDGVIVKVNGRFQLPDW